MIDFAEWFDIDNKEHLAAFKHMCDTGAWPIGFLPENIMMEPSWFIMVANKMAYKYIENILGEKNYETRGKN